MGFECFRDDGASISVNVKGMRRVYNYDSRLSRHRGKSYLCRGRQSRGIDVLNLRRVGARSSEASISLDKQFEWDEKVGELGQVVCA
jgi:hypothetical protein